MGYRGLQGLPGGYKEYQWVTRNYWGLQEVTECDKGLKGEQGGYSGAQGATRGYNKNLVTTLTLHNKS